MIRRYLAIEHTRRADKQQHGHCRKQYRLYQCAEKVVKRGIEAVFVSKDSKLFSVAKEVFTIAQKVLFTQYKRVRSAFVLITASGVKTGGTPFSEGTGTLSISARTFLLFKMYISDLNGLLKIKSIRTASAALKNASKHSVI